MVTKSASGCSGEGSHHVGPRNIEDVHDPVNAPRHYRNSPSGVECIEITEHMNFCVGNAVKYLWRCGEKNDLLEDLKKARWYIDREIRRVEVERATEASEAELRKMSGAGADGLIPLKEGWDPYFIEEEDYVQGKFDTDRWNAAGQVFIMTRGGARVIVKSQLECDEKACAANKDTIARRNYEK